MGNIFLEKKDSTTEELTSTTWLYPYTSTIELALVKLELSGGAIEWRDMGAWYDNYSGDLRAYLDSADSTAIETAIKNPTGLYTAIPEGFYPLTPLVEPLEDIDLLHLALTGFSPKPNRDGRNIINEYTFKYLEDTNNLQRSAHYTPTCDSEAWTLGGVSLPYPAGGGSLDINEDYNAIALHGTFSLVDRSEVPYNEIATLSVKASLETTRALLEVLVNSRGGVMPMDTISGNFSPFGLRYHTVDVFATVLADNKIKVKHINNDTFVTTFKLQNNKAESLIPPTIITQPTDQTITAGDTATFTVVADGTAPLSYQWYKDSTIIAGETSATLEVDNVGLSYFEGGTVEHPFIASEWQQDAGTTTITQSGNNIILSGDGGRIKQIAGAYNATSIKIKVETQDPTKNYWTVIYFGDENNRCYLSNIKGDILRLTVVVNGSSYDQDLQTHILGYDCLELDLTISSIGVFTGVIKAVVYGGSTYNFNVNLSTPLDPSTQLFNPYVQVNTNTRTYMYYYIDCDGNIYDPFGTEYYVEVSNSAGTATSNVVETIEA